MHLLLCFIVNLFLDKGGHVVVGAIVQDLSRLVQDSKKSQMCYMKGKLN